jgi:hypothetical protein
MFYIFWIFWISFMLELLFQGVELGLEPLTQQGLIKLILYYVQ